MTTDTAHGGCITGQFFAIVQDFSLKGGELLRCMMLNGSFLKDYAPLMDAATFLWAHYVRFLGATSSGAFTPNESQRCTTVLRS